MTINQHQLDIVVSIARDNTTPTSTYMNDEIINELKPQRLDSANTHQSPGQSPISIKKAA